MYSNEGLEGLVSEYTDSELLRTRVETIRQLSRLSTFLAIIDDERRQRAPQDQEATILQIPTHLPL